MDATSIELRRTMRSLRSYAKKQNHLVIATLGPEGTSSELCSSCFCKSVLRTRAQCKLFLSYEEAAHSVEIGESDLLLVANAYHKINEFYISYSLELATFFVFDTADYGIAARSPVFFMSNSSRNQVIKANQYVVSTHPAPAHLIPKLMGKFDFSYEVEYASSTSQAAKLVASGITDLCLTNTLAATREGLKMCTETYQIKMLWSVFKSANQQSLPKFNTPRILSADLR